jgi:hypothetical protein
MSEGVARAKYVLSHIGTISSRLGEHQEVRKALASHMRNLYEKPTKVGVKKAHQLLNEVLVAQKRLPLQGDNDVALLKSKLSSLTTEKEYLIKELSRIQKHQNKKEKVLSKKVGSKKLQLGERLDAFEKKYEALEASGTVSEEILVKLRKKIREIKKKL